MVFSSLTFLGLFLPLVLLLHTILPAKARNYWLLLASLLFYAWGEGAMVFVMLGSIVLNYIVGQRMEATKDARKRKSWLWLAIVGNLGLLLGYKYLGFVVQNLNHLLFGLDLPLIPTVRLDLPIGISFFTFQALSYVIDLYRERHQAQRNPFSLALYISLFPQLIAGPIVRYQDLYQQLQSRILSFQGFTMGTQRFLIGLAKKVLIADQVALFVDKIFLLPIESLSPGLAWIGVVGYALQIYFDFSAYSDMAIGLGHMLGFHIPENFNYPYIATSIRDFWRRWHISLSTWFRDYLYIPLGGNRGTDVHTGRNLVLVFLLCGLWHGASWTFVIWGAYHGLFLLLERTAWGKWMARWPKALQHLYTLIVVLIGWLLFRAESMSQVGAFLGNMLGLQGSASGAVYAGFLFRYELWFILLLGMLCSLPIYPHWERQSKKLGDWTLPVQNVLILGLGLAALMGVLLNAYTPFIYFRF